MDRRAPWIAGLVILAGLVTWRLFATPSEERGPSPPGPVVPGRQPERGPAEDARTPLATSREPARPAPSTSPGSGENAPEAGGHQPTLAGDLDQLAGSFLTTEPRVAELLALCQDIAARAAVDPERLQIERDADGRVRFARGELAIDELRGTFLIEEGTCSVRIASAEAEPPFGSRDVLLTFGEDLSRGEVVVQFHPRPGEPASRHLATGGEKLVGWGVSFAAETGARARPLTVRADGDDWQIADGAGWRELELPWISATRAFEAWMRLLEPHSGR